MLLPGGRAHRAATRGLWWRAIARHATVHDTKCSIPGRPATVMTRPVSYALCSRRSNWISAGSPGSPIMLSGMMPAGCGGRVRAVGGDRDRAAQLLGERGEPVAVARDQHQAVAGRAEPAPRLRSDRSGCTGYDCGHGLRFPRRTHQTALDRRPDRECLVSFWTRHLSCHTPSETTLSRPPER